MPIPLHYAEEKRVVTPLTRTIRTAVIICSSIHLAFFVNFLFRWIQDRITNPPLASTTLHIPPRWYLAVTNGIQSMALILILVGMIWPHRIKHLFGILALCASVVILTSLAGDAGVYLFPGGAARSMPINWIIINLIHPFKDVSSLLLVMMWLERRNSDQIKSH